MAHDTTERGIGSCDHIFVAAEKRRVIFLFLRAVPRKMLQFFTLETACAGEKILNMGKMWSLAALGRPTIWLIPPASVEAVTLQLQSDLLFGAVAFATLLVSELAFAKTLLAFERLVLRNAGHVNPFTIVVFELVVHIFVPTILASW